MPNWAEKILWEGIILFGEQEIYYNHISPTDNSITTLHTTGAAKCSEAKGDGWRCTDSCDRYKSWGWFGGYKRTLLQEEQCDSWACSCKGDFRGLQVVPPDFAREEWINCFNLISWIWMNFAGEICLVICWQLLCLVKTWWILFYLDMKLWGFILNFQSCALFLISHFASMLLFCWTSLFSANILVRSFFQIYQDHKYMFLHINKVETGLSKY